MINLRAENYAKILFSMNLNKEIINDAKNLLNCKELMDVLDNPVIKENEKEAVIERLFNKEITDYIKVLCRNASIGLFPMIMEAYEDILLENQNILKAKLKYVIKPDEEQLGQIKNMLCNKYKKKGVSLELEEDASLIGGYVLYVGNTEYDKSMKGALSQMQKTLVVR